MPNQRLIDANLAKFVDQQGPVLCIRFLGQQVVDQCGFTGPEIAGDDVDGDRADGFDSDAPAATAEYVLFSRRSPIR